REAVTTALDNTSPAIREAAVPLVASMFAPRNAASLVRPLLQDKVKSVRITAAWQLMRIIRPTDMPDWIAEYESVQQTLLSRANSHVNLANLYRLTGRNDKVAPQLHTALKLNPN